RRRVAGSSDILIYTDPKTPRTEPGKNDLHYCQRTTASGDCRLRPAGAERSRFGNGTSGWTVRLYVSKGARPIAFTTSSLGSWQSRWCRPRTKHLRPPFKPCRRTYYKG